MSNIGFLWKTYDFFTLPLRQKQYFLFAFYAKHAKLITTDFCFLYFLRVFSAVGRTPLGMGGT